MPGFSNISSDESIMFADNVSFDGTQRGGKLTTDGQLLIGATASPHIRVGTLSSTGSTITITPGAGTINLEAGASIPTTFTADTGSATPALNILTVSGGNNVSTSGSGSTLTFDLTGTTDHAIQLGNATGSLTSATALTNGQLLIGSTGADPVAASVTSTGSTIVITPGAGTLNLEASAATPTVFHTDSGDATPALNALSIVGAGGASTSGSGSIITVTAASSGIGTLNGDSGSATGSTVTIAGAGSVSTSATASTVTVTGSGATTLHSDTGDATVSSNAFTIAGGTGIATTATGSTLTVAIDGSAVGETITGDTGGALSPTAGNWNIVGAGTVSTSGSGSTLTITGTGGSFTWNEVVGTTQAMAVNNGYILNNGSEVTATLPSTAAVGDIVAVVGKGAGGWKIAQNSGQTIHFGSSDTTTGATGYLEFTNQYDSIELICITANTDWVGRNSVGNITVA